GPGGAEEVAAGGGRVAGGPARRCGAVRAAAPGGPAQRGGPGACRRAGRGGRRQTVDRERGRGPARRRAPVPGGDADAGRRTGRVRRDRRVHHRAAMVKGAREPMTVMHPRPPGYAPGRSAAGPATEALARARDHLLGLQHDRGWWQGELETNVTMDAEDLLVREFLGVRTAEQTQAAARWIASQQRADGTWANFYGGPGDLSTTEEAYLAPRPAGHQPPGPPPRPAAGGIRPPRPVPPPPACARHRHPPF